MASTFLDSTYPQANVMVKYDKSGCMSNVRVVNIHTMLSYLSCNI